MGVYALRVYSLEAPIVNLEMHLPVGVYNLRLHILGDYTLGVQSVAPLILGLATQPSTCD